MKLAAAFTFSFALALPFISQSAWASCGTVEVSKGDIKIFSAQTKQLAPAAVGAKICSGDTITAGADSRAKLKMEDGNELNISPDSKIVLESYQFNPAQNKKKVLLNVLQGKVRATTQRENMYNDKASDGDNNTFQVRTKSAVAGVRGTDFLTGYDSKTGKSEVVTFRGKVDFGQPGPNGTITNAVHVGAGQKTEASPGQPPAPPHAVPAKELNSMKQSSAITPPTGGGAVAVGSSGGGAAAASGSSNGGTAASGSSSNGGPGGPAPASVAGPAIGGSATGSMVDSRDSGGLALTSTTSGPTTAPPPPLPPPVIPFQPPIAAPYIPPQVTNAITNANSQTKVNIQVNLPH
jgi:hypothetical protein